MDTFNLIMTALQLLLINPKLGGGGAKREQLVRVIEHIKKPVEGGRATALELEAFAARIHEMAVAGQVPTERDFMDFTGRLDAALATVEEAKRRVEDRQQQEDAAEAERQRLAAEEEAQRKTEEEQQRKETEAATSVQPKKGKKGRTDQPTE